ncbi:MAG: hypothetical protein MHMPM18_003831 [Marteilia pararefringens]
MLNSRVRLSVGVTLNNLRRSMRLPTLLPLLLLLINPNGCRFWLPNWNVGGEEVSQSAWE